MVDKLFIFVKNNVSSKKQKEKGKVLGFMIQKISYCFILKKLVKIVLKLTLLYLVQMIKSKYLNDLKRNNINYSFFQYLMQSLSVCSVKYLTSQPKGQIVFVEC